MAGPAPDNPADPCARKDQTFPVLAMAQIERVKPFGRLETLPQGETLFARGDRTVDFFALLSGTIEIYDDRGGGEGSVCVSDIHKALAELYSGA